MRRAYIIDDFLQVLPPHKVHQFDNGRIQQIVAISVSQKKIENGAQRIRLDDVARHQFGLERQTGAHEPDGTQLEAPGG